MATDNLSLSHQTVKSQACSAYRKLGVASRSHAVARSWELVLLRGRRAFRRWAEEAHFIPIVGCGGRAAGVS
jgi:hypothetical protein